MKTEPRIEPDLCVLFWCTDKCYALFCHIPGRSGPSGLARTCWPRRPRGQGRDPGSSGSSWTTRPPSQRLAVRHWGTYISLRPVLFGSHFKFSVSIKRSIKRVPYTHFDILVCHCLVILYQNCFGYVTRMRKWDEYIYTMCFQQGHPGAPGLRGPKVTNAHGNFNIQLVHRIIII